MKQQDKTDSFVDKGNFRNVLYLYHLRMLLIISYHLACFTRSTRIKEMSCPDLYCYEGAFVRDRDAIPVPNLFGRRGKTVSFADQTKYISSMDMHRIFENQRTFQLPARRLIRTITQNIASQVF